MNFDKLAKLVRKLAYQGKDYEAILKEIEIDTLSDKKRRELLSLTDDFIVQYQLAEQIKSKYLTKIILGSVVLFIGIFILFFTYLRNEHQYNIGVAAALIGLYIIKISYKQYQQPIGYQDIAPKKDSIFERYGKG